MKMRLVWSIFVFALLLLLLLQGMWLYSTFLLKEADVKEQVSSLLINSVEKELDARFLESSKNRLTLNKPDTFRYEISDSRVMSGSIMSQQFDAMQQLMMFDDNGFDIHVVDSIYSSLLKEDDLNIRYVLYYKDSIQTIDIAGDQNCKGSNLNIIPIVNDTEVQAIVNIPLPAVFKHMIWMLAASVLMLFLIMDCLVYELKVIFTQQHLTQLRDDFTHALTHDMKTPLGTIYMVVDQWKKGVLDNNTEMRTKFCEIAIEQVLNMQALVDKILTIARLEQDRLILETQTIDLPDMIQGLVEKFSVQGGKPVGFTTHFDLQDSVICADPTYLKNAISNLIDNAIKYSGNSVNIELNAYTRSELLYIKVKDDGLGISFKDQQKIFDKFERGGAVKRKEAKGFGLGLNYVKRMAEAHGGTIAVSSLEGQGSEFVIVVPLIVSSIE